MESKHTALAKNLRIKSDMINMGERIQWGSETALMDEAATTIEHLEAALIKAKEAINWRLDFDRQECGEVIRAMENGSIPKTNPMLLALDDINSVLGE